MWRTGAVALLLLGAACARHPLHTSADAASDAAVATETAWEVEDGQAAAGHGDAADDADDGTDAADAAPAPPPETQPPAEAPDAPSVELPNGLDGGEPDAGPACVADPHPPPDVPARQTVRFHFASSSPDYLISQGFDCLPFVIETSFDGGTTPILLNLHRNDNSCEGLPLRQTLPAGAIALDRDGGAELTWDARQLEPHALCADCIAQGWGGLNATPLTMYTRVPVTPGHYRATFAVLASLPFNCWPVAGGADCQEVYAPYDPGHERNPPLTLCPSSRTLSVDFELPSAAEVDSAAGDVDVTLNDTP